MSGSKHVTHGDGTQQPAALSRRAAAVCLVVLLATVTLGHVLLLIYAPPRRLEGDEPAYLLSAFEYARTGQTNPLPGWLPFGHRPTAGPRLYSQLVPAAGDEQAVELFQRRVAVLNLVLLLALLLLVYWQARTAGLSRFAALVASTFLGLFPWFGYHVHTLWPEIMHAFLLAIAFGTLLVYLARRRLLALVPAGVCLAYAAFVKGTVNTFLPIAIVYVAVATVSMAHGRRWRERLLSGVASVAVFGLSIAAVLLPQLLANHSAGYGYRLAANQWRNIEWGLRSPVEGDPPKLQRFTWDAAKTEYFRPRDLVACERESQKRTLKFVRALPWTTLVSRQFRKLAGMVWELEAPFEASVGPLRRWGHPAPTWIRATQRPARAIWYALVALSLIGVFVSGWRGAGLLFLSLFFAYYAAALLTIPVNLRFAMQLVPTLCLFSGAAVDGMRRQAWGRFSRATAALPTP